MEIELNRTEKMSFKLGIYGGCCEHQSFKVFRLKFLPTVSLHLHLKHIMFLFLLLDDTFCQTHIHTHMKFIPLFTDH